MDERQLEDDARGGTYLGRKGQLVKKLRPEQICAASDRVARDSVKAGVNPFNDYLPPFRDCEKGTFCIAIPMDTEFGIWAAGAVPGVEVVHSKQGRIALLPAPNDLDGKHQALYCRVYVDTLVTVHHVPAVFFFRASLETGMH